MARKKSLYDGMQPPDIEAIIKANKKLNEIDDKKNQPPKKNTSPKKVVPQNQTNLVKPPASTVSDHQPEPVKPKYILTNDTITVDGHKLHRIQAIRDIPQIGVYAGDLGGYVEFERNLDHRGSCWVFPDGMVYHNAVVRDGATVRDHARAYDNAIIEGNAALYDDVKVFGNAYVGGGSKIYGHALIHDRAKIFGEACIGSFAQIGGMAQVYGRARIMGNTIVIGNTKIHGDYETIGGNYVNGDIGKDTDIVDER